MFGKEGIPGVGKVAFRTADSGYLDVDWKGIIGGQDHQAGAPSGRPDLQRRSDDLLSTLGPRIAEIQDRYAKQYGWTPNPGVRLWEREGFEGNAGAVIPSPPIPWRQSQAIAPEAAPPPATAPPALQYREALHPFFAGAADTAGSRANHSRRPRSNGGALRSTQW